MRVSNLARGAALLAVFGLAQSIYLDNHEKYAMTLTNANFDSEVKAAVESDRTLMVRWIASTG